jgi:hypothetical protein
MISPTGNATVDATILTAEATRQTAVSVASTQAATNVATTAFYRSVLAGKRTAGLDVGNEIAALQNLGATV